MTYQGFDITISQKKAIDKLSKNFGIYSNVIIISDIGCELQVAVKDDSNMQFAGSSFNYWINRKGTVKEDN